MSQFLSGVAAWHVTSMSLLLRDKTRRVGVGAALPVKSHFWIGRGHPPCAGVIEW